MNDLKTKSINSLLWEFINKFSNTLMNFILIVFLARILSPSDFGLIALAVAFLGLINLIFDIGLGAALIQKKITLDIHFNSVFFFNILVSVFLCMVILTFSNNIALFYGNKDLERILKLMSIFPILVAFSSVFKVKFQKELMFNIIAKTNIIATVISGLIAFYLALNNYGVYSLIALYITNAFVSAILFWVYSEWKPKVQFSFKALKNLWKFGFHIFMVSFLNAVYGRIDILIAAKLVSPAILGFYDRAKNINQLVYTYTAGILSPVLFSTFSKIQKNNNQLQYYFNVVFSVLTFVVFWLIGLIFISSDQIIIILYSEKWLESSFYLKLIILSVFSHIYGAFLVQILVSRGKSKLYFKVDVVKKALMSLNILIGFSFGLIEFLVGSIFVSFLIFIIDLYYATKELKIKFNVYFVCVLKQIVSLSLTLYLIDSYFNMSSLNILLTILVNTLLLSILYLLLTLALNYQLIKNLCAFIIRGNSI